MQHGKPRKLRLTEWIQSRDGCVMLAGWSTQKRDTGREYLWGKARDGQPLFLGSWLVLKGAQGESPVANPPPTGRR